MAKLTDSKEYKAFYKLLFTASEDENGSVANWSDLWDAMDSLILHAEGVQYDGDTGVLDDVLELFDSPEAAKFSALRDALRAFIRRMRQTGPEESPQSIPLPHSEASHTGGTAVDSTTDEQMSKMAVGLSLGQQSTNDKPPGLETTGAPVRSNSSQGPGATETRQEHGRVAEAKSGLEGHGGEGPEKQTKDGKKEKQVKGKQAGSARAEDGKTNVGDMEQEEDAKKSQKRKGKDAAKEQSESGESEQEQEDQAVESRKRRKKKRRISSKAMVEEEAVSTGEGNVGSRGYESKPAPPRHDKSRWPKARPPNRCQQCVVGRRVCEIYMGRPLGRARIACVQCNSMRKGCSFKQGEMPFKRRRRGKKLESDVEDFGSEYYDDEDDDEAGDDDEDGDDDDDDADVDGKPKKGKGVQKKKEKKRQVSPTRSERARSRSRARSVSRPKVTFQEQGEDMEWIHTQPGEAGPASGVIRRPRSTAQETAELWARFREIEGTNHDFRREVRGDVTQIRQDIGRLKEDQDTSMKFLGDKILAVEQGLQSQVESVREQTREISSAMKQVVDRVGNLPTELRNVMDTWGTIRFGALRQTPTTVSAHELHADISGWIEQQKQLQEGNGGQQEQSKFERNTPSPTFDISKWVDLPPSQNNPEADRPAGGDTNAAGSGTRAEVSKDNGPVKVEHEECLYGMMDEHHMQSQEILMEVDKEVTEHMEVDEPVVCTAVPAINVIGATPSGSLRSIAPGDPAGQNSGSSHLSDSSPQANEQEGEVNHPITGNTSLQPVTSIQGLPTPPLAGVGSEITEEAPRPVGSESNVGEGEVSVPAEAGLVEENIRHSPMPAPLESIHGSSRSYNQISRNPTPIPSPFVAMEGSTEPPSTMDESEPTPPANTIRPDQSSMLRPPMPSPIETVEDHAMSTQSTQSTIETCMPPSSMETISAFSQADDALPPAPQGIPLIAASAVASGDTAGHLEVPALPSPDSRPGPMTRSRSRSASASRSLPAVVEAGQVSQPTNSKGGRKPVSKRG